MRIALQSKTSGGHRRLGRYIPDTDRVELDVNAAQLKEALADPHLAVTPLDEASIEAMPPPKAPAEVIAVGDFVRKDEVNKMLAELHQKIDGLAGAKAASESTRAELTTQLQAIATERDVLRASHSKTLESLAKMGERMEALEAKLTAPATPPSSTTPAAPPQGDGKGKGSR